MFSENEIDDLIEAGWYVLETDFDVAAYKTWKQRAFECVTALMGPDHPYTLHFKEFVGEDRRRNLLAGEGLLCAVKERVIASGQRSEIVPRDISRWEFRSSSSPEHVKATEN